MVLQVFVGANSFAQNTLIVRMNSHLRHTQLQFLGLPIFLRDFCELNPNQILFQGSLKVQQILRHTKLFHHVNQMDKQRVCSNGTIVP